MSNDLEIIKPARPDIDDMSQYELLVELVQTVRDLQDAFLGLMESAKDNPFLRTFLK